MFVPYVQRKTYYELKPGDFVRIQGDFYIIDEIRRFRRPFDYSASQTDELTPLTGSLKSRFQHIDKFAVDPEATCLNTQVVVTYRGTDITGMQYGHVWTTKNADADHPAEIDINSFSREDIISATITYATGETGDVSLWFSGEEYTLVEFPKTGGPAKDGMPGRFVIAHPYGFSRVITKEEFEEADMKGRLRT